MSVPQPLTLRHTPAVCYDDLQVRSLHEARVTQRKQDEIEAERAEKLVRQAAQHARCSALVPDLNASPVMRVVQASWAAKYEQSAKEAEQLRRETAMVRRVLGIS